MLIASVGGHTGKISTVWAAGCSAMTWLTVQHVPVQTRKICWNTQAALRAVALAAPDLVRCDPLSSQSTPTSPAIDTPLSRRVAACTVWRQASTAANRIAAGSVGGGVDAESGRITRRVGPAHRCGQVLPPGRPMYIAARHDGHCSCVQGAADGGVPRAARSHGCASRPAPSDSLRRLGTA